MDVTDNSWTYAICPGSNFFGVREQTSDVYYVHKSTNGSPVKNPQYSLLSGVLAYSMFENVLLRNDTVSFEQVGVGLYNFRRRKLEEVAKQEKLPQHPNCVRFYRAWEERHYLYLLVELCKTR